MKTTLAVQIIAAALPPALDGIGDYTAQLAAELARAGASVSILAGQSDCAPIPGVRVLSAFCAASPASVRQLIPCVERERPDWLLLQYNAFSFGRRGLNLHLPLQIRSLRRRQPGTKFALMVHEAFVPIPDVKHAIMTTYQRWQLWMLGRSAAVVLFSTEPWANRLRHWFPRSAVQALPVGSNIPRVGLDKGAARARLGVADSEVVLGVFGTAHNSRLPQWVRRSAEAVQAAGRNVRVLYLGPDQEAMRQTLGKDIPLLADGALPGEEVSRRFAAMDIFLTPFVDGISTRRTSLMTALQHGIPTVGTVGSCTDTLLRAENGRAFLLAEVDAPNAFVDHVQGLLSDPARAARLGQNAERVYAQEFAWPRIAGQLTEALSLTFTDNIALSETERAAP